MFDLCDFNPLMKGRANEGVLGARGANPQLLISPPLFWGEVFLCGLGSGFFVAHNHASGIRLGIFGSQNHKYTDNWLKTCC